MRLDLCKAIITGGASGLGKATAEAIIANNGKVAIFDLVRKIDCPYINKLDRTVFNYYQIDITDEIQVSNAINNVNQIFGSINTLINCAGINLPAKVLSKETPMSLEIFKKVIEVNLIGTFNVIRLFIANLIKGSLDFEEERGVIINTSSIAAFEGQIGQTAYSASKAGLVGMTLPMAREFASLGIRVMTIAPGLFNTPMLANLPDNVREALGKSVPFPNRLGQPSEYADLVLAIIKNAMLNGEIIRLDGSLRMQSR